MVLTGTEVKAAKSGKMQLKESYAAIEGNEAWLHNAHISEYSHGNRAKRMRCADRSRVRGPSPWRKRGRRGAVPIERVQRQGSGAGAAASTRRVKGQAAAPGGRRQARKIYRRDPAAGGGRGAAAFE